MLKSIHDKASKAQIQTPKPLPIINNQTRKRNRKPDKSSICHVVHEQGKLKSEKSAIYGSCITVWRNQRINSMDFF